MMANSDISPESSAQANTPADAQAHAPVDTHVTGVGSGASDSSAGQEAPAEGGASSPTSHESPATQASPAAQTSTTTQTSPDAHKAPRTDIFKFAGLIVLVVVMVIAVAALWPYIGEVFEEGGLERLIERVRDAGWKGVLILEAVQFLQVVVAFIPGEVTQMAAGILYGPWWGAVVILVGCILSSAFVFVLVHRLGAPFVHDMVPKKYMDKFRQFEKSGKFNIVVFILFLIPGMPKDVFTYITPLSDMKIGPFLLLTNLARIPGIVVSTYAANGLMEGHIGRSVVLFAILAVIAVAVIVFYNKIMDKLHGMANR